jgi:hypothetical protein
MALRDRGAAMDSPQDKHKWEQYSTYPIHPNGETSDGTLVFRVYLSLEPLFGPVIHAVERHELVRFPIKNPVSQ